MMKKKFEVSVYWLVNHIIHNWHEMLFIESIEYKDNDICEWGDDYYESHKEELHSRIVSFICVEEKKIKVYLKEKK